MEKFGIFNLISALTQMNAEERAESGTGKEERAQSAEQKQEREAFGAGQRMRRAQGLLERHEAISRRIDRNNR